jgi:hypothetical protein
VDGGGDERPRNRTSQFAATLLRRILNLDKVKVISYAEGSSKRHSVERYHFAEGRSLSQGGIISSRSRHEQEIDEDGAYDDQKFEDNMEHARMEAIERIDKTPYAKHNIYAYKPPTESDWVFPPEIIGKILHFLKTDSTSHRQQHYCVIKTGGPIWEKLVTKYSLKNRTFHSISVYNEMTNPDSTWRQHYGFTVYRPDDCWRGAAQERFEVQPVLDVSRLPDYHFLPYKQARLLVDHFITGNLDLPKHLKVPDFCLPSKNIERLRQDKPECLIKQEDLNLLGDLIGVEIDSIRRYIKEKEEKELLSEQ